MVGMVFTEKSLEECLEGIGFDKNKLIKRKLSDYERKHIKLFTGEDPGEYEPFYVIDIVSPPHRKEIHERILKGESLEISYSIKVALDSYISDLENVDRIAFIFLENPPKRPDVFFFSEVFTNCIEWGNDNEGELDIHIWVTNKGSLTTLMQKNEWDYKRYISDFKKGIAKPRGGGAGIWVIDRRPYEVGYTNNGRTTYILITKEMIN